MMKNALNCGPTAAWTKVWAKIPNLPPNVDLMSHLKSTPPTNRIVKSSHAENVFELQI